MPKIIQYIDHLARSGLYGRGARSQAVERLISEALQAKIHDPILKSEWDRLHPNPQRRKA
jgi:hypothetical protein